MLPSLRSFRIKFWQGSADQCRWVHDPPTTLLNPCLSSAGVFDFSRLSHAEVIIEVIWNRRSLWNRGGWSGILQISVAHRQAHLQGVRDRLELQITPGVRRYLRPEIVEVLLTRGRLTSDQEKIFTRWVNSMPPSWPNQIFKHAADVRLWCVLLLWTSQSAPTSI